MSFSKDDFLTALRQGANLDQLATEITNNLNAANEAYEAERRAKEAAEKAKREKELNESLRNSDLGQLTVLLNKYIAKYHKNLGYPEGVEPFRQNDLRAMFCALEAAAPFIQAAEQACKPEVEKNKGALEQCADDFSAAIDDFLDRFVR